jgi:hypothetical protein
MEFNEQPLTYKEIVAQVNSFENTYKISSEDFFASLAKGVSSVEIHSDDLYEWRSYYAFKCDIDKRVALALRESDDQFQEIEYSTTSDASPKAYAAVASQSANNNLALAA